MLAMKQVLQRAWLKRGWLARLLWPVAKIHCLVVRLRLSLYRNGLLRSERFRVPVIVVGNIVAGGAGKTPLVIELVRHLNSQGLSVGVVSRGYGRFGHACIEVNSKTPVIQSGDEPAHIKKATDAPVFVASKRTDALRALLAAYPATKVVV
ncbi:MAG: tetraacyldisaccharide 4'-kinase, partial [Polaromonas sp.]|nr:tetraacyldisaccharide 4'-kinase [Polaromonas sp.]